MEPVEFWTAWHRAEMVLGAWHLGAFLELFTLSFELALATGSIAGAALFSQRSKASELLLSILLARVRRPTVTCSSRRMAIPKKPCGDFVPRKRNGSPGL